LFVLTLELRPSLPEISRKKLENVAYWVEEVDNLGVDNKQCIVVQSVPLYRPMHCDCSFVLLVS